MISDIKVLILDDDPDHRDQLVGILNNRRCTINVARNAQEAMRLLEEQDFNFDLFVSEMFPPCVSIPLSGVEIVNYARKYNPDTKTLLMSRFASLRPDARAAHGFLLKPVKGELVDQELRRISPKWFYRAERSGAMSGAVLIAESDNALKTQLEEPLTSAGFKVSWVRRGEEAIAMLKAFPKIKAVFVGPRLYDMRGVQLVRAIKGEFSGKMVIFVALDPQTFELEANTARSAGADRVITQTQLDKEINEIAGMMKEVVPAQP